jgi:hypothetical protein
MFKKNHYKAGEGRESAALYRNFFNLFDVAVQIFSKTWQFPGTWR